VLDHEAAKALPVTLPRVEGDNHMIEWLEACKGGPTTFTNLEIGAHCCQVFLPGIISLRLGRPIEWDAANLKVPGAPEADPFIQKNHRMKVATGVRMNMKCKPWLWATSWCSL